MSSSSWAISNSQRRPAWAVFISGRGSNLQALLDLKDEVDLRLIVSSRAQAPGIGKAKREGLRTLILDSPVNWQNLHQQLVQRGVSHICLAGFMKIVPEFFIQLWKGRIINLHPSLLPNYPGLNSIKRAHQDRAELGVSLHQVVPEVDAGPLIFQKALPYSPLSLSLEEAEFFTHICEHQILRGAIRNWV